MKLGQQLRIKQSQSLIMTPQLQQAIKLLQLSNVELAEFIENAKLENPFLKEKADMVDNNKIFDDNKSTPDICDNLNNTVDPLKNENITEMQNTFDSHISSDFKTENKNLYEKEVINSGNAISAGEVIEKTSQNKVTLRDHLINQINLDFKNKIERAIAIGMIDYLHPSGWFITPISEVAQDLNIDENLISNTLLKLQKLEPSGIFSEGSSLVKGDQLIENNQLVLGSLVFFWITLICYLLVK